MSIAKSASIRQAHWDCPLGETTQTRGSNFLGAAPLFRRLKLPKGASLHSLRHSHCSHLLASGVPLPAVSARLGHGSIRTTQEIYSHMIHGQDDEAARKWEEFQSQPTGGEPQQKGRVQ
jgi:integrase